MSFQLSQTDAPVSTTAGFTRTGRCSELAANTSAAASTVQLAVLRCATTSCRRPLALVRTHVWPGFQDSVVSVWTATRAHGVSRLSIRFSLHSFCNSKSLMTSGLWARSHWKAQSWENWSYFTSQAPPNQELPRPRIPQAENGLDSDHVEVKSSGWERERGSKHLPCETHRLPSLPDLKKEIKWQCNGWWVSDLMWHRPSDSVEPREGQKVFGPDHRVDPVLAQLWNGHFFQNHQQEPTVQAGEADQSLHHPAVHRHDFPLQGERNIIKLSFKYL